MTRDERTKARRDGVLLALRKTPDATSKMLGEETPYVWKLESEGWVCKSGKINGKGRPANTYKLSEKGRKRAAKLAGRDRVRDGV